MQKAKCKKSGPFWRDPFLHFAFCILHFGFLACATDSIGDDLELRTLTTGSYATSQAEEPRAVLIESAADYERIWAETIGGGERPAVDFDKESVVILLAGLK